MAGTLIFLMLHMAAALKLQKKLTLYIGDAKEKWSKVGILNSEY